MSGSTIQKLSQIPEWFIRTEIGSLIKLLDSWMKAYSVAGASISAVAAMPVSVLQEISGGILVGTLSGPGWNLVDSVGGTLSALHTLKKSRTSAIHQNTQTLFGGVNLFWFGSALPALTLWGYASEIQSIIHHVHNIKSFFTAGATAAAAPAMAASSFAFAIGMFVMAGNAAYKWYRAGQKVDPVYLLKDRLEKLDALNEKIGGISPDAAEAQPLVNKRDRIKAQAEALYQYCTNSKNLNETQKTQLAAIGEKRTFTQKSDTDTALAHYLIQKQQRKIEANKFDFVANLMGGIGATFAGLAALSLVFFPPATIALAFAAATFFGISAGMKTRQLLDKRAQSKNIEKAFANVKGSDTNLTKEQFEEKLIINFFNRSIKENKNGHRELKFSEIEKKLSATDKKEIIAMEAKFSLRESELRNASQQPQ